MVQAGQQNSLWIPCVKVVTHRITQNSLRSTRPYSRHVREVASERGSCRTLSARVCL